MQSGALDHGLTIGTDANILDLDSHKLLNVLHVIASPFGQIVVGLRVVSLRLPPWHLMINHLSLFQDFKIRGIIVHCLSLDLVSDRDFSRFKSVQNVELCQIEAGVIVD